MATDNSFESGMGPGQSQGVSGNSPHIGRLTWLTRIDVRDDYGVGADGAQAKDYTTSSQNVEEGLSDGRGAQPNNEQNNYGLGNEAKDTAPAKSYEEGMGAKQDNTPPDDTNEFGMGSGRPKSEEGMGIIPGHESKDKEGGKSGGFMSKVENLLHKVKK